jgi:hypothetical protein
MFYTEERNQLNAIDREVKREINFETNLFIWKLLKLSNDKTKIIIIEENDKFKEWRLDDSYKIPTEDHQDFIAVRQTIVNWLEIFEDFPKKIWDHCRFTKVQ